MSRRIPTPGRAPATGWGEADRFTADDQVAVTFLSVQVLTMAARAILDTIAEALNASLRAVDPDRDLVDEPDPLGPGCWPGTWKRRCAACGTWAGRTRRS
ncbi:DUF6308 family protein [Rhodococcus sp. JS3073]|uniref:DUF6308 family protein n=1 Tax=Rhodococcus sp. JS3073 TaxID=3002901 RepID=UPI002286CA36|nr:DUF6308 family protein [Rhodococcus sp. JS3073]WAM12545.1 DUF6308 family protein [Rhodococcus sp. JS3073]